VALICQLILAAIKDPDQGPVLISLDEKTGIQALERIAAQQPPKPGQIRRLEYEYKRHGTICLMAAQDIGRGKIIHHRLHPKRKERDWLVFVQQTTHELPLHRRIIYLADQLNTHMSVSLVKWVAEQIDFQGDLGKPRYKGILRDMKSRRAFLEDPAHRIRFVFTPKHCSWINPIENWFSKLQRHVIQFGNFQSVNELKTKICEYIDFYNRCLYKPMKWKFKGFTKDEQVKSIYVKT
jgi:hypothetical protein